MATDAEKVRNCGMEQAACDLKLGKMAQDRKGDELLRAVLSIAVSLKRIADALDSGDDDRNLAGVVDTPSARRADPERALEMGRKLDAEDGGYPTPPASVSREVRAREVLASIMEAEAEELETGAHGRLKNKAAGAVQRQRAAEVRNGTGERRAIAAMLAFASATEAATPVTAPGREGVAVGDGELSQDVVRLVIAARRVSEVEDWASNEPERRARMRTLDQATEAFASRVPWEDGPEDEALAKERPAASTGGGDDRWLGDVVDGLYEARNWITDRADKDEDPEEWDIVRQIDKAIDRVPKVPCDHCGGNGYSGGIRVAEPEMEDACEVCLGSGVMRLDQARNEAALATGETSPKKSNTSD